MSDEESRFLSLFVAENVSPDAQRQRGGSEDGKPLAYFAGGYGTETEILEANETAPIGQVGGGRRRRKSRKSKRANRKRKTKTYRRRR